MVLNFFCMSLKTGAVSIVMVQIFVQIWLLWGNLNWVSQFVYSFGKVNLYDAVFYRNIPTCSCTIAAVTTNRWH
ncbi:MAG: hypothetical protein CM15mV110_110 [Caudoviricetes sp.]|nr:MAG: hypothetical protein CM15mV110_110 [Caudoviricetes sp.]